MGGRSSEHDISLASARSVMAALDPDRYEVVAVEIGRDGRWELAAGDSGQLEQEHGTQLVAGEPPGSPGPGPLRGQAAAPPAETLPVSASSNGVMRALAQVDVVLPILHGPFGEDGKLQGLLDMAGIPYVGAGVEGSAMCMDKDITKRVLRGSGIPVTRSVTVRPHETVDHPFDYPVFVKPARLGSSVGVTKVTSAEDLEPAVALARRHDEKVLIEEFVTGVEVECGVLGNRRPIASLPGEIVAHGAAGADWYDFSAKYDEGGMDLIVPPRIPEEQSRRVQEVSIDAFLAMECEGMARVDCFALADGRVLINELNTIPGFTATSVYAKLFEQTGIAYQELLERLIDLALERERERSALVY
jgi:D-alanine-D-alanine ligase